MVRPRKVKKCFSDWVYLVQDLCNGIEEQVHAAELRFYCDSRLDTIAILPHVTYSETRMSVSRLLSIEKVGSDIYVHVRWKGPPHSDETLEPLRHVFQDVPRLLKNLHNRKQIYSDLRGQPCTQIHQWEKEV